MGHVIRVGLALAVLVAANLVAGPPNLVAVRRHPAIHPLQRERIEALRPELVLLGNSILREGLDEEALGRRLGVPTLQISRGGAASAWWYLALKNLVAASEHRVPVVAIVFRDHFLTEPSYRVQGEYKRAIDRIAGADEPVLDRLAYGDGADAATHGLERWLPLLQRRRELRDRVETLLKDRLVGGILGREPGATGAALERVFARERQDPERLGARQAESEAVSDVSAYDFAARVPHSFLPEMIRVAQERGIRLVFVRAPRRRRPDLQEAPALAAYLADLDRYLGERGIPLLDLSGDPRLAPEHFADGDHLGPSGRTLFTEMLADALETFLQEGPT